MADRLGYQCEFVECVPEHFLCSKCIGVARRLTFTSCCGESYCHGCIAEIQQKGEPCPACEEKAFTTSEQVKFQRRIMSLQVYCSMKERGCDWNGTLDNLDAHLDPDGDNCQHVDTKCPFDCQLNVPKNKLNQHVEKECSKRPYTCQHCGFKGTYEEVLNVHLPECKYVPLQCPNRCGVTCDREDMDDHLKMCRLEEVACEFSGVGCEDKCARELKEEHVHMNSQSHLSLTAASLVRENLLLQQKLLDQKQEFEGKLEDQEKKLQKQDKLLQAQKNKTQDQQKSLQNHETTIQHHYEELQAFQKKQQEYITELKGLAISFQDQQKKLHEQERKLEDQKIKLQQSDQRQVDSKKMLQSQARKLQDQEKKLQNQDKLLRNKLTQNELELGLTQRFVMANFSEEEAKTEMKRKSQIAAEVMKSEISHEFWRSPIMYSRTCGYKFDIKIYPIGCSEEHVGAVCIQFVALAGQFDHLLKWPVTAKLTLELVHQQGGRNVEYNVTKNWKKSSVIEEITRRVLYGQLPSKCDLRLPSDEVKNWLLNDTLEFNVSKMVFIHIRN